MDTLSTKSTDMNSNNEIGAVTIEGGYATLRYERRIPQPLGIVWKTITDPKEVAVWFNTAAQIDMRPGGTISPSLFPARSWYSNPGQSTNKKQKPPLPLSEA
jgi:Activator of Hsp90 ATPase homolog 1-like protein